MLAGDLVVGMNRANTVVDVVEVDGFIDKIIQ